MSGLPDSPWEAQPEKPDALYRFIVDADGNTVAAVPRAPGPGIRLDGKFNEDVIRAITALPVVLDALTVVAAELPHHKNCEAHPKLHAIVNAALDLAFGDEEDE